MAALEDSIRETLKDGIHFQAVMIECLNPQAPDFDEKLASYQATRQGLKRQLAALNNFRRQREDLEDEVNIQNVVLQSLDRGSADYAEQHASHEATKKDLEQQMAELNRRTIEMFSSGSPIANGRMDVNTERKSSPPEDWVNPTLGLPTPTLELDFRISCQLNPIIRVGEGPWGQRNWISFKGGEWTAKWGRGTIEVSAFTLDHQPHLTTPLPAWRPRLPTRPPRLPTHFRLNKLPAPHQRRPASFHHCANDRVADRLARSNAAALRP
jgi:hypothetical protein